MKVILILLLFMLQFCIAEDVDEQKVQRWVIMPILGHNAEMGSILGTYITHFLPAEGNTGERTSSLGGYVLGTTNKQYELNFYPDLYFNEGDYHLEAHLIPRIWRGNYYGFGNESDDTYEGYDTDNFEVLGTFSRLHDNGIFYGPEYRYLWEDLEPESGGMLETDGLPGLYGGKVAGLGFTFGYDTRDNTNAPYEGYYLRYSSLFYREFMGSDFEYNTSTIDLRKYLLLKPDHVFCFGGHARFATGEIPYRELSTPDGVLRIRGIEKGRYIDNHLMAVQAEYRWTLNRRFGMTFFGETGRVAHEFSDFEFTDLKTSVGAGFRIALAPDHRFNLRIDISNVDGNMGFVIDVREAF